MKPKYHFRNIFSEIAAILLILLFTYASVSKLLDYQKFRVQLGQSPVFTSISALIAWIIPSIELIVALMLSTLRLRQAAFYLSLSLMTMFSTYIIIILNYSEYIPCSCGGILQDMGWRGHLIFNIIFLGIAIVGTLSENSNYFIAIKPGQTENL
jgi:hypothetical protein